MFSYRGYSKIFPNMLGVLQDFYRICQGYTAKKRLRTTALNDIDTDETSLSLIPYSSANHLTLFVFFFLKFSLLLQEFQEQELAHFFCHCMPYILTGARQRHAPRDFFLKFRITCLKMLKMPNGQLRNKELLEKLVFFSVISFKGISKNEFMGLTPVKMSRQF